MAAPILIIEDDTGIRDMLVDCLVDAGYPAFSAANGSRALELLGSGEVRPALILLDLAMPLMSGQEFLKIWRERGGATPVIVLTADLRERGHADQLGVDCVLTKPLDLNVLLAMVEELVGVGG